MNPSSKDDAWVGEWTARWDAMQDAYVPHRREAFALMADILVERFPDRCRVIDLGAGAGTLAETILNRHPNASVLCVDVEPFLLEAARRRLKAFGERAKVVRCDLRREECLAELAEHAEKEKVEAVVTSTTTHWFSEETLGRIYAWTSHRLVEANPPGTGGLLMVFDHIPPDDEELATLALEMNEAEITCRFQQSGAPAGAGALTWEEFWDSLSAELGIAQYNDTVACPSWGQQDGPETGHPLATHKKLLHAAGLRHTAVMWRHLTDALLAATR